MPRLSYFMDITMTKHVNKNGLTLAQFRTKAFEAGNKYGDDLFDLDDAQDLFEEWDNDRNPVRVVDELALAAGYDLPCDWDGDTLRYWLVSGRCDTIYNQQFVYMAYDHLEAAEQFCQAMDKKDSSHHAYIDLVVSCGREYPNVYTMEEL